MRYVQQRVYLLRHGETAWSLSGQHTGLTDLALTENGRAAAKRLAPVLGKERFELVPEVDVLDLASGAWSTAPQPPVMRLSAEVVAVGKTIYVVGGSSPVPGKGPTDLDSNDSIIAFDPATGAWRTVLERTPFPTRHTQAFAWRDRLLLYSAHVEGQAAIRLTIVTP